MTGVQLAEIGLVIIAGAWVYSKIGLEWMKALVLLLILALIGAFVLVHLSMTALNSKSQAATVRCVADVPHHMLVTLNGVSYELAGDHWMLQSSVIEVQPWLYFIGVKSGYTLDRLDSQFDDPNHQTAKPIQLNGFSLYKSTNAWMLFPLIKSAYGNGIIQNCDGRTYNIFVDQSGDMSAERR